MNRALGVTIAAVGRRFAVMVGTGLLAFAADQWTHWLRKAMEGDPRSAVWIPVVWMLIEFAQKFIREIRSGGMRSED